MAARKKSGMVLMAGGELVITNAAGTITSRRPAVFRVDEIWGGPTLRFGATGSARADQYGRFKSWSHSGEEQFPDNMFERLRDAADYARHALKPCRYGDRFSPRRRRFIDLCAYYLNSFGVEGMPPALPIDPQGSA